MAVDNFLVAELVHHHLGNLVTGTPPDINDLVIPLTLGYQTVGVLGFNFLNLGFSGRNDFILLGRNQHVIRAERNASASRQRIAVLHQLVGEDDSFLKPAAPERLID